MTLLKPARINFRKSVDFVCFYNQLSDVFPEYVHKNAPPAQMLVMKAIVYDAPRKFAYRDISVPKIQANEILLRVHACGVC